MPTPIRMQPLPEIRPEQKEARMQMPVVRVFNASAIQSITPQGLTYVADGEQHFIDFAVCRRNWVDYVNSSPDYATTDLGVTQTHCIATRNASAEPPSVDFLTIPPTRFVFERAQGGRNWLRRNKPLVADLVTLQRQIQQSGCLPHLLQQSNISFLGAVCGCNHLMSLLHISAALAILPTSPILSGFSKWYDSLGVMRFIRLVNNYLWRQR